MVNFLIVLLFFLLLTIYVVVNKEILSPSFIVCGMFLLSSYLLIFYYKQWELDLSINTIFIIISAIIAMFLGELSARAIKFRINNIKRLILKTEIKKAISINNKYLYFCLIFVLVTAVYYYYEILRIGSTTSWESVYLIGRVRAARTLDGVQVGYLCQQMYTMSQALAYIYGYIVFHNGILIKKFPKNITIYFIISGYVVTSIMSGGRSDMMNYIIYLGIIAILLVSKRNNWKYKHNIKILAKMLLLGGIIISLFYMTGYLTGKSTKYNNIFDNVANYFSSSIYALNNFLNNRSIYVSNNDFFGIHTFLGLYKTLGRFFDIPNTVIGLEYIPCGYAITNIYTALRRYYQDFGLIGMYIIMFFIGFLYTKILNSNKAKNSTYFTCIATGYLYYPLIFMPIEERLFMNVISSTTLYSFIYMLVFYKLIIARQLEDKTRIM